MQKILITVIVATTALLGAGLLAWFFSPSPASTPTAQTSQSNPYGTINNSTTVTPADQTNSQVADKEGYLSVTGELGGLILVKDFKSDPTVEKGKDGRYYYLAGGIDPNSVGAPYGIDYTESDQSFNIVLLKEPLGDFRKLAEQELMQRLDINTTQACGLRYWVSVPTYVNSTYSTKNLGFSFCPGATRLP